MFLTITPSTYPVPGGLAEVGARPQPPGAHPRDEGGGSDTPLPQLLSSVGTYTQEGDEDILDAGSLSSADQVTNLVLPSRLYKPRF